MKNGKNGKITVPVLKRKKQKNQPIVMLTAYDATFARILDTSGVDAILVGDSLGMVVQGLNDTLAVTMDEMIYHCRMVSRGVKQAHLVGDLPFMSYQVSPEEALRNGGRLMKEGRVEGVKLEGGRDYIRHVELLTRSGIPVMGHIGLTPQSVHCLGGFKVQGRSEEAAQSLTEDALALEAAGAYALVLESIPAALAASISQALSIPTIGIGAGGGCDGQVLVIYDLLGMSPDFRPKFLKTYDNLHERISGAVGQFIGEVRDRAFPGEEHSF